MVTDLTADQEWAVAGVLEFFKGGGKLLTIGGFAGTGKTTILAHAIARIENRPAFAFCALSGKAASVLKSKLEASGALSPEDYVGTIHGLIYETEKVKSHGVLDVKTNGNEEVAKRQPFMEGTKQKIDWRLKDADSYAAVVIDEASMVSGEIFGDLEGLGMPILAVGDHGQLPPIGGDFNLMEDPMIRLEKIHRQAEGDPIIQMSMEARERGKISIGKRSELVEKIQATGDRSFASRITPDTMVLCGRNDTRVWWNNRLRSQFGFVSDDPEPGERVICLKNNPNQEVYNGMTGIIQAVRPFGRHWYWLVAKMDSGAVYEGKVLKHQFGSVSNLYRFSENGISMSPHETGDLFDWGWAITTHKSQGSEWSDVVVIEERISRSEDDWRRWLYTAITRAKKSLLVVGS